MAEIWVNGERHEVPEGATVRTLLEELKREPKYLAVERNCTLVPRTQHAACRLEAGDRIEIVTLVGGG